MIGQNNKVKDNPSSGSKKYRKLSSTLLFLVAILIIPLSWMGRKLTEFDRVTIKGPEFVLLPDGTTALLNENSILSYSSDNYGQSQREVSLVGEAYFEVSQHQESPFIVRTRKITTRAMGTAFNICAYPQDSEVIVTAEQGKAEVSYRQQFLGSIVSDQQLVADRRSGVFKKFDINANHALSWRNKYLVFNRITIREVVRIIEERYGVSILIKDESLKECVIFAKFLQGEQLDQILAVISTLINASFTIDHNRITIVNRNGSNCKPHSSLVKKFHLNVE